MKRVLSPNKEWGPAVEKYRTGLYASPETFNEISKNGDLGVINGYDIDNAAFVQDNSTWLRRRYKLLNWRLNTVVLYYLVW